MNRSLSPIARAVRTAWRRPKPPTALEEAAAEATRALLRLRAARLRGAA